MINIFEDILQSGVSRREKVELIAEQIRSHRNYSWVGLYEVNEKDISIIAYAGRTEPAYPIFPRTKGLNGRAVASKEIVVVNDISKDNDYLITFGSTQSEIIVPVYNNNEVIGTIDVESEKKNAFTDEDVNFLQECSSAIEKFWNKVSEYQ